VGVVLGGFPDGDAGGEAGGVLLEEEGGGEGGDGGLGGLTGFDGGDEGGFVPEFPGAAGDGVDGGFVVGGAGVVGEAGVVAGGGVITGGGVDAGGGGEEGGVTEDVAGGGCGVWMGGVGIGTTTGICALVEPGVTFGVAGFEDGTEPLVEEVELVPLISGVGGAGAILVWLVVPDSLFVGMVLVYELDDPPILVLDGFPVVEVAAVSEDPPLLELDGFPGLDGAGVLDDPPGLVVAGVPPALDVAGESPLLEVAGVFEDPPALDVAGVFGDPPALDAAGVFEDPPALDVAGVLPLLEVSGVIEDPPALDVAGVFGDPPLLGLAGVPAVEIAAVLSEFTELPLLGLF
jgi:hypothetical protein